MADHTAVLSLRSGTQTWTEFRSSRPGAVDLRLADLAGVNIAGLTLSRCDLSGADLSGSNLDGCAISDCVLSNASLEYSSLVDTTLNACNFAGSQLGHAVIRRSRFSSVQFSGCDIAHLRCSDSNFNDCFIEVSSLAAGVELTRVQFVRCTLEKSSFKVGAFRDVHLVDTTLKAISFDNSKLSDWALKDSKLLNVVIRGCAPAGFNAATSELRNVSFGGSSIDHASFVSCLVDGADMIEWDIGNTPLINSTVLRSAWPSQRPRISLSGRYSPSPHLLDQPVQDISGLRPRLRREIADAQYLEQLHNEAIRRLRRFALRVWGATCEFGQSLARLSLWALSSIGLLATILPIADGEGSEWRHAPSAGGRSLRVVGKAFLGLTDDEVSAYTGLQAAVVVTARLAGFFVLGLWIGVAANKLGRLSSE